LAAYIAASAPRSRQVGGRRRRGAPRLVRAPGPRVGDGRTSATRAMPTLRPTTTSVSSTANGARSALPTRSATRRASSSPRTRSSSTANSSPPSRATVSLPRVACRRRTAASASSRSPAAWPNESLTFLKSSRST
jgi:hypothetical protein